MKGVMRFGEKGKLSPRYLGPYEIFQRFRKVSYEFKLPCELALVHWIFHVYMLKKCLGNPVYILPIEGLGLNEKLYYEEVQIDILDLQVQKFWKNWLPLYKSYRETISLRLQHARQRPTWSPTILIFSLFEVSI